MVTSDLRAPKWAEVQRTFLWEAGHHVILIISHPQFGAIFRLEAWPVVPGYHGISFSQCVLCAKHCADTVSYWQVSVINSIGIIAILMIRACFISTCSVQTSKEMRLVL